MSKLVDVSAVVPQCETPNRCTTLRERWRCMQETAAGTPAQRREALRVYRDEWHTSVWADAARLKIKKKGAKVYVSWRMPSNNYTVITPCLRVETLMIELCWLLTCLTTDDAESALEAARNCRRICETWANVGDVVHYMQEFSARYYIDIENIISAMIRMTYEGYETCLHVAKNSRFPNVRVWGETVASMTFVSMCDRNAERLAGNGCLEEALALIQKRDEELERARQLAGEPAPPKRQRGCEWFSQLWRQPPEQKKPAWETNLERVAACKNIEAGVYSVAYFSS